MSLRDEIIAKMNADWRAYQRTVRILTLHDREFALLADAALAALRPHEAMLNMAREDGDPRKAEAIRDFLMPPVATD